MDSAADCLPARFTDTRQQSLDFCAPLEIEDYGLQAEAFTSPPKWHLAHSSWFFETFLLKPFLPGYQTPEPSYEVLFNSYYNGIGEQFPRPRRGLLSRPTVAEVMEYRTAVDSAMMTLLDDSSHSARATIIERCTLGIEHERQHQELFFTDIKYSLAINPLLPSYSQKAIPTSDQVLAQRWQAFDGGLTEIGYKGPGFCFDNEQPRHRVYLEPFELAQGLVSNAQYAEFIADGGYERPELWLSDGWTAVQENHWKAPLYWMERDGEPLHFTLHGLQKRQANAPVCHVSGYEADAFARWAGARLPTEQEWELAAQQASLPSGGVDTGIFHPLGSECKDSLDQLYDSCWQWTRSAYTPYPGYSAADDAIGEYNGKFMSNQWVLRGGSCVSKAAQLRPSYRNFFYPPDRWQFSGIRLARDLD